MNAKDFIYGWTPLMQATFYGHQEVTKSLLKCGADPTITAFNGCTALGGKNHANIPFLWNEKKGYNL